MNLRGFLEIGPAGILSVQLCRKALESHRGTGPNDASRGRKGGSEVLDAWQLRPGRRFAEDWRR